MNQQLRTFLFQRLPVLLWDLWCIVSIVGIWPRFIEPRLLLLTRLKLRITDLAPELRGVRVVQISDLHFSAATSERRLAQIRRRIHSLKPDLLVFTGGLH